jgi:hypothetical protein
VETDEVAEITGWPMTREPTNERKRHSSTWTWTISLSIMLLVVYSGAYVLLSDAAHFGGITQRSYSSGSICRLFVPLAWVEAKVTGNFVEIWGYNPSAIPSAGGPWQALKNRRDRRDVVGYFYTASPFND